MELVELYNKAVVLVEDVKKFSPQTADDQNASLCVIVNGNGEVYAGVTGIRIANDKAVKACSEYNAFMSMLADGHINAKQMMTVSFADGSVCRPCSQCIDMICRVDENNAQCEIAVSKEESVKACELGSTEASDNELSETVHNFIDEAPAFSEEPISDSFSFEEKFGFDFDDTPPETPVPTLADQNQEPKTIQLEQPVNPYPEQYQNAPQGMNPQFAQPNNMQAYNQPQGYPYPQQQGYPQGYPYPQQQGYPQGYPYPQQGYPQGYPQQNNMNPQFVQPDMQQGYSQPYPYVQQPNQPVNQGNFMSNAQPYPQNPVSSQALQNVYPHQPAPYTSSHYMSSSSSQPIGSVPLSGEGKSKFRQRLNKFMSEDSPVIPSTPVSKPAEESLTKDEIKKMARDKKKMAKVNADFKKRMKDLGY